MLFNGNALPGLIGASSPLAIGAPTCNTFRCQNVASLAICILDQRDVRAAVWIVFETLNNSRNPVLIALEIDDAVTLLVTTAMMTNRDSTSVVTTTRLRLLIDQRTMGLAFVQARRLDRYLKSASCGRRF